MNSGGRAIFLAMAVGTLVASCATPTAEVPGEATDVPTINAVNDCETLVVLKARTTAGGVEEQAAWLAQHYPDAEKVRQTPTSCGTTPVERIVIRDEGTDRAILFDVSSFYGRVGEDDLDDLLDG